ncbi:CopG family transcriptional regulator [Variovorax sp. J22R133]|uniref:CopG family ribbon-helix-helix protein n=1 Tax=Variovorax brevis TaxID=3053503 RepID=UPI002577136E|nr:CopG family transcriptional regulator [Variovorax sp. J22R133]MDM0116852.1 CopG family transcriptional regulator [Variovorax sp. J22R133]
MPTTTIRIDDSLKDRIAIAAERAGTTSHAFIVDAIAQTVARVEADEELHQIADKRWAKVLATGKTVPWDEARKYIVGRARKEPVSKPAPRKIGT